MTLLEQLIAHAPRAARPYMRHAVSLAAGIATALMLHYLLYRIEIPGKPFIYVAF